MTRGSDPPAAGRTARPAEPPPRTAGEMLARGRDWLAGRGRGEARLEAELLVAHALGLDRLRLFLALERPLTPDEVARARELFVRRASGEPVAYLIGQREFYGRRFGVGPEVLVPRPETELIVDLARARVDPERGARRAARFDHLAIADLGTGSGCLAISLALELPGARVVASDVSAAALERARANAVEFGADVEFREGDGLAPFRADGAGAFDLVVSNPPYVEPGDPALDPDVQRFEPGLALFAPAGDPDRFARLLVDEGPALVRPGGAILVELGVGQAERVAELVRDRSGLRATIEPDLGGLPRVLVVDVEGGS